MRINFFDDPLQAPRAREDVRINQIGIHVYPDRRRVAIGFDISPFIERPSLEVSLTNARGEAAGNMTIIESLESNFHVTMHLQDKAPTDSYQVDVALYYGMPDRGRMIVHKKSAIFDLNQGASD